MAPDNPNKPVLYVVATPVGNLGDISLRATRVLSEVDLIAAEDTRVTLRLLNHLEIKGKEVKSYHNFNEENQSIALTDRMVSEQLSVALVSDAGTPCVSDPGFRLVYRAHQLGIRVIPVPGPSAMTAMVSASGLPSDRLLFVGFLPVKAKALQDEVQSWPSTRASVVFFESARRLQNTLRQIEAILPEAVIAVGRELTKVYEEVRQSKIQEAVEWAGEHSHLKGELVVVASPGKNKNNNSKLLEDITAEASELRKSRPGLSHKSLVLHFSNRGIPRKELYALLKKVCDDE